MNSLTKCVSSEWFALEETLLLESLCVPFHLICDEGLGRADLNLDGELPCVWQAIPIFIPLLVEECNHRLR